MFDKRASGILAHPTSFPGPYGMGDLGAGAYAFIDFLKAGGQKLWQVLPLGPTGFGDSPYQSFSSFAGNHYLISFDSLKDQGLLTVADLAGAPAFDPRKIDYGPVITYKMAVLRRAYEKFKTAPPAPFKQFCKANKAWLDDYALFVAIKAHFIALRKNEYESPGLKAFGEKNEKFLTPDQVKDYYYGATWTSWPEGLAKREKPAITAIAKELADDIDFCKFLQYEFFHQWGQVKAYANQAGIQIIGDIPIFVAQDSADVWANPELYQLDADGNPTAVAGVPPDYFSETGQLWGNPLYDWPAHKKTDYAWWCRRIGAVLSMVDIVRIDHFRGFDTYWSIPYGEATAVNGKWKKGPGKAFFDAVKKALGNLPIIAEDLGDLTDSVHKLRDTLKLPGMRVLHFAFEPGGESVYLPHNYETNLTVVYSGTHDNDTSVGWYQEAPEAEKDYFRRYMNVSGEEVAWDMIRLAMSSSAIFSIVPIQDVMSLPAADRMNKPGDPHGWWGFRYTADMLSEWQAEKLAYLAQLFYRG
ncbi:MAG: 4-alpha-glucanotransferase [Defluviitaleaceae bacterium]|nr:4-alpha-glucanotransferase [Defluviitaleaceae bacterium]